MVLLSALSMILGSFAAVNQQNIKRLMAYSSIGHVGYGLIAVVAAGALAAHGDANAWRGIQGLIVYFGIYLFMNVGTFAVILVMRRSGQAVEQISDLAGLSKTNPALAFGLMIMMLSMAGIPPLAGFFGKFYVFVAAIQAGYVTLAIIGVLASVVSAYYYLRIVKVMYFDDVTEALDKPDNRMVPAILGLSTVIVVGFAVYTTPFLEGGQGRRPVADRRMISAPAGDAGGGSADRLDPPRP